MWHALFKQQQAGKLAPLIGLRVKDMDINTMFNAYNTARNLERNVAGKKPWVIRDVLDLCDERRDLKKQYEAEGAKEYRGANKRIQKAVKEIKRRAG